MFLLGVMTIVAFASNHTTPAERFARCPEEKPYAYYGGHFCCKFNKQLSPEHAPSNITCTGEALLYESECCFDDNIIDQTKSWVGCEKVPCYNAPAKVNCGTSKAMFCSKCGQKDSCSGDCEWRHNLCQPKRPVNCGKHVAEICGDCPRGIGKGNCAGDCEWTNETCVFRLDTEIMRWDDIIVLVMGIIFFLIFLILLYCCLTTNKKDKEAEEASSRLSNQTVQRLTQHETEAPDTMGILGTPDPNRSFAPLMLASQNNPARITATADSLLGEDEIEAAKLAANPNLDDDPDRKNRVGLGHEIVHVGQRVVRGPDWEYKDQDGGKGNVGIVGGIPCKGWVMVKWELSGTIHAYKAGQEQVFHLSPAPPKISKKQSNMALKE